MCFDDGLKSSNYNKNPHSQSSGAFDDFERGRTQAIKRGILNLAKIRADIEYHGLNNKHEDLRGSTLVKPEISKPNSYALLKGK